MKALKASAQIGMSPGKYVMGPAVQNVSNRQSVYTYLRLPPTSVNPACELSVWPNVDMRPKIALYLRLGLIMRLDVPVMLLT